MNAHMPAVFLYLCISCNYKDNLKYFLKLPSLLRRFPNRIIKSAGRIINFLLATSYRFAANQTDKFVIFCMVKKIILNILPSSLVYIQHGCTAVCLKKKI